ncbi:MAG: hypothetical protein Q8Q09_13220 [Deltaproteobacteria bacterium]|nr:hypothetical protein [Deltaproteobacteria bacterium]
MTVTVWGVLLSLMAADVRASDADIPLRNVREVALCVAGKLVA